MLGKNIPTLTVYNRAKQEHSGAPVTINGNNLVYANIHGVLSLQEYIGQTIEGLVINSCKVNLPSNLKKIGTQTHLIFEYIMNSNHEVGIIKYSDNTPLTHHG